MVTQPGSQAKVYLEKETSISDLQGREKVPFAYMTFGFLSFMALHWMKKGNEPFKNNILLLLIQQFVIMGSFYT